MAASHRAFSQHPRLGRLPVDWLVRKFGEITTPVRAPVDVIAGKTYREIGIRSHGKGIFHKEPVESTALGDKRVFWVKPDCLTFNIVFAWEGAVARTTSAEAGMIGSHRFPMHEPWPDVADVEYLRRFFQTQLGIRLLSDASPGGAGRNRTLNQKLLAETPVPLPPLREQRRIAAILSSVDEVIERTEGVMGQLHVVKKMMMQDLLTHGLPGRHVRFKRTEVGEIPVEWDLVQVDDVVTRCDYGISEGLSTDATLMPVLRMGNLQDGEVLLDSLKYVDSCLVDPSLHLNFGDVLFNRTNSKDLVGKVGLFVGADRPVTFASYLLRLQAAESKGSGAWLCYVLNTDQNQARLRAMATPGVSQANINRTKLLGVPIPLPPLDEQQAIVKVIDSVNERYRTERANAAALRDLRSTLVSVLLSGELRVFSARNIA